jgi:hypothetical protein
MKFPTETKPVLMGAALGAIGLAIVGFAWGGWTTGSSAEKMAKQRAESAVVLALTPGCVAKFNAAADAVVQLATLKKTNSWEQGSYIEKGGWATAPGATAANSDLARACAAELTKGS